LEKLLAPTRVRVPARNQLAQFGLNFSHLAHIYNSRGNTMSRRRPQEEYLLREFVRQFLHESITSQQILDAIHRDLVILSALESGGKAAEFIKDQIKGKALDMTLTAAAAIPFIGAKAAALKLSKDVATIGIEAAMKLPEVVKAANDILKIAAGEYVGMDDDDVGNNPLAKVFNIDDRMEYPLKQEYLKKFAGKFTEYLKNNPDTRFPDRESAAEMSLEAWLQNNEKTKWKSAKGPPDPT